MPSATLCGRAVSVANHRSSRSAICARRSRSGARTSANAGHLADAAKCEAYILDGGIEAWKRAGLPVQQDNKQPIEIVRQVQIAAGGLVLLGVVLGFWLSPAFFLVSAVMGAGLTLAGATGWCGLAKLLGHMPWNRRAAV